MNEFIRILSGAAVAGIVGTAVADTLELRDGRTVDGALIGATGDTLYLRAGGEVRLIRIDDVGSIRFDRRPLARSESRPGNPAPERTVIVAAGTPIMVSLPESLVQGTPAAGDRFMASLSEDVRSGELVVSAAGSKVFGRVVSPPGGMAIMLTDLVVEGNRLPIRTASLPLPPADAAGPKVEFRVEQPFTLKLASN